MLTAPTTALPTSAPTTSLTDRARTTASPDRAPATARPATAPITVVRPAVVQPAAAPVTVARPPIAQPSTAPEAGSSTAAPHAIAPPVLRPSRPRLAAPTPLPATSTPGRRHLTRLVSALVEAMAGRRSRDQLAQVLTHPAQTALRVLPRQPRTLRVRSVHLCQVDRAIVEVAATLVAGSRAKALAARLEHTGKGWQFTALHLIGG